jgi:hypothetical protein
MGRIVSLSLAALMTPVIVFLSPMEANAEDGPHAEWKRVQDNRVAFSAKQALAYAAVNGTSQRLPDLNAAIDAANQAQAYVLDGSNVQFAPAQEGGVSVTVTPPGDQPQRIRLSVDAFRKYLNLGRNGQWDKLTGRGVLATLQQLSQPTQNRASPPQAKPQPQPYVIPKGEGDAYVPPPLKTNFGKTPSTLNLSGNDYMQDPQPDKTNYGERLEARSWARFPSGPESERQQWMAEQEQRAIANEINRTKPLRYPVSGR